MYSNDITRTKILTYVWKKKQQKKEKYPPNETMSYKYTRLYFLILSKDWTEKKKL